MSTNARLSTVILLIPLFGAPDVLTGTVTDPIGDSSLTRTRGPDLMATTMTVQNEELVVTISFAPGTLSDKTGVTIWLDTDENAATGTRAYDARDPHAIGADYVVRGVQPHNPAKAVVTHETSQNQSTVVGSVEVTSPAADQRRIVIPMTLLGNDDGRLQFKLECYQIVEAAQQRQVGGQIVETEKQVSHVDLIPNYGAASGVVR